MEDNWLYRGKKHVFQHGFISPKSKLLSLMITDVYTPTPLPPVKHKPSKAKSVQIHLWSKPTQP